MFTFAKFCRLCCKNNQFLVSFTETDLENISYYDKIKKLIPKLVTDNCQNFPMWICVICREEVNQFYMFHEKCLLAHELLQTYSKKLNAVNSKSNILDIEHTALNAKLQYLHKKFGESDIHFSFNESESVKEETGACDEGTRCNESDISVVKNEIPVTEDEENNFKVYLKDILKNETKTNAAINDNINEQSVTENNTKTSLDKARVRKEEELQKLNYSVLCNDNSLDGIENDFNAAKRIKLSLKPHSFQNNLLNDDDLIINNVNNVPLSNELCKSTENVAPLILQIRESNPPINYIKCNSTLKIRTNNAQIIYESPIVTNDRKKTKNVREQNILMTEKSSKFKKVKLQSGRNSKNKNSNKVSKNRNCESVINYNPYVDSALNLTIFENKNLDIAKYLGPIYSMRR